jgi:predicted class III extradiol MEMO1 family dioxygenase
MIRPPAVSGRFYPSDEKKLALEIEKYTSSANKKSFARGCVVPHAGYLYSGHVAGAVYSEIEIPARCILLGPRHFPGGEAMAIISEGSWRTPFGDAQIDSELAAELKRACPLLREDRMAHEREHSLEVQIPFLQQLAANLRFVPVVLATQRYQDLETLDMNHYESDAITRTKDHKAIDRMLALDPRGLYDLVRSEGITMCGYAATAAMLTAMRDLGAKDAELIRYATSGDITGDWDQVVGYAGIIIR